MELDTKLHALTANITARMVVNRRFSKPAINSSIGTADEETYKVWGSELGENRRLVTHELVEFEK